MPPPIEGAFSTELLGKRTEHLFLCHKGPPLIGKHLFLCDSIGCRKLALAPAPIIKITYSETLFTTCQKFMNEKEYTIIKAIKVKTSNRLIVF